MIFPLTRNLAFFKFLTSFFLSFFLHEHKPCFYSGEKIYLIALDQTSTFFIYLSLLSCISSHNSCIIVLESRLWKKKAFMAIFSHNFFLKNVSLKSCVLLSYKTEMLGRMCFQLRRLKITIGIRTICTIKVDINKAYDSVRLNFLLHCLRTIGTPDQFYAWVKECISTPQYYIALNGVWLGTLWEKGC